MKPDTIRRRLEHSRHTPAFGAFLRDQDLETLARLIEHISAPRYGWWSPEEHELLTRTYMHAGLRAAQRAFPLRSRGSIRAQIRELRLVRGRAAPTPDTAGMAHPRVGTVFELGEKA